MSTCALGLWVADPIAELHTVERPLGETGFVSLRVAGPFRNKAIAERTASAMPGTHVKTHNLNDYRGKTQ